MALEEYRKVNFRPDSLAKIEQANEIIAEYEAQGLRLTLRQLYYQFVSRDLLPNNDRSYKNLGNLISDGRLSGLVDWDAIEDRVRVPKKASEFDDLAELVDAAVRSYRLPRWKGQDAYVELWVEKDALAGVLEPIAREFHVALMVNRGYSSQTAMYEAAQRFIAGSGAEDGDIRELILFYLGDLDPSGEDMVRDVHDRLAMFGAEVDVRKLALTMPQVDQYKPPPNPAKLTDSRAAGFVEKYGSSSWEVDALPPNVLRQVIQSAFKKVVDADLMDAIKEREKLDKEELRKAAEKIVRRARKAR